jgi:protease II
MSPATNILAISDQPVLSAEWDDWEILLDANQRAAHSEFYTLGGMSILAG